MTLGTAVDERKNDVNVFDIPTGRWSLLEYENEDHAPVPRSGARCMVHRNRLHVVGGHNGRAGTYFDDVHELNLRTRRWRKLPNAGATFTARTDFSLVKYKNSMVVFGGYNGHDRFDDMLSYSLWSPRVSATEVEPWKIALLMGTHPRLGAKSPVRKLPTHCLGVIMGFLQKCNEWKEIVPSSGGEMPSRRFGHSAVAHRDSMWLFGGWNGRRTLNDLFEFNFLTRVWRKVEVSGVVPHDRYRCEGAVSGDKIFIFGGVDRSQRRYGDLHEFSIDTETWCERELVAGETDARLPDGSRRMVVRPPRSDDVPSKRTFHGMTVSKGGVLYVMGGFDGAERLGDVHAMCVGVPTPSHVVW